MLCYVHRVRAILDEVFGEANFVSEVAFSKTTGQTSDLLPRSYDLLLWYAKSRPAAKFRKLLRVKTVGGEGAVVYTQIEDGELNRRRMSQEETAGGQFIGRVFATSDIRSQSGGDPTAFPVVFEERVLENKPNPL